MLKKFGVKENLKSPTFNYVLEYLSGRLPLYHFDVYRLCSSEEIYEIGYEDYINNGGVALIEWANIISEDLPKEYIRIEFKYAEKEDERIVDISYVGTRRRRKNSMLLLGIDTSTKICTCSIYDSEAGVIAETSLSVKKIIQI